MRTRTGDCIGTIGGFGGEVDKPLGEMGCGVARRCAMCRSGVASETDNCWSKGQPMRHGCALVLLGRV